MSAIVGLYFLDHQPIDRAILVRMTETLAHRGADNSGIWSSQSVGFGHRMLWSTPESILETLPYQSDGLAITADARIDNREELIAALNFKRQQPDKITDSQLILAAYEKWGEACPAHLIGDFAFAIWNQRTQTLFCARDPMGIKPFYYYHSRHLFAFASEIKALFCLPQIPRQLNELRVAQYLIRAFDDRELTFYQNIWRLPAAHSLTISAATYQVRSYWSLDPDCEVRLSSDQEYVEAYREVFNEAVRCRLRSAFPVGSMLSGGLDSSSIACTARNFLADTEQSLHTFSAIFPSLPEQDLQHIDERFYIEKVLAQGGFIPHFIEADQLDPLANYDQLLWHIDEAFCAPNLYLNWAWYQTAQQNQVRVVLDGIDGDTTVSHGQAYLAELVRAFRWKRFLSEARAYAATHGISKRQVLWEWGVLSLLPGAFWKQWNLLQERIFPAWRKTEINSQFAKQIKLSQHCQTVLAKQFSMPVNTARHIHWHSLNSGLIQYALELADKASAAWSVELRFPFCDRRLMEFCLALPPEQKFSRGWSRLIARRAMEDVLPVELRHRLSKANLGINSKQKIVHFNQHKIEQEILQKPHTIENYIDKEKLYLIYRKFIKQPLHEQSALSVYTALVLMIWLKKLHSSGDK